MNISTLLAAIKVLVATATGFTEHQPRISEYSNPVQDAPNTGVYRVVVMATGQTKHAGLTRYADLAIVVAEPLSGGDANKTNEEQAASAEALITTIADYAGTDAQTEETVDATISRDAGRSIITFGARILYKLS